MIGAARRLDTALAVESAAELCRGKRQLTIDTDVVVVGSGAAGSVVAAELAESGQRVLILEEGPYVAPAELATMRPSQTMRRAWREAGMTFAAPVGNSPLINVHMGRCVGGSSVMTGGVCFRTPDEVLDEWVHGHGLSDLSPQRMAPFFEEVERRIHVEAVPAALRSRSTTLFEKGAAALGYGLSENQRNTDGCCGCSRCNFGCPHGAKLSVDLTYLPRALSHGARVLSGCLVERVLFSGEQAVGVRAAVLLPDEAAQRRTAQLIVRARRVVVAAGAWHTPRLLFQSGLGPGLPALGRNLTLHPSFRVMARFDERIEGWRGALQSMHSKAFESERITLMSVFVPLGVLAATLPGVGPAHAACADLAPHLAVFGGMIHDDAGGRVHAPSSLPGLLSRLLSREPLCTYKMSRRDRAAASKLLRILGETFLAAGAREVFLPILGKISQPGVRQGPHGGFDADSLARLDLDHIPASQLECASQHPLGTCRMGLSRDDAVVDDRGQVFGLRELYVVDSGVLPSSLGVNPQLSVMAMATRLSQRMRERRLPGAPATAFSA
jgi:choline dehydrogenase-like flavoprotein